MKKLIVALVACAMFFAACPTDDGNDKGNGNGNKTTLTITNINFMGYCEIAYGDVKFDLVHNTEETKAVSSGTRYAYITYHYFTQDEYYSGLNMDIHNRTCTCPVLRAAAITCEEGKNTQFSITRNTVATLTGGFGYDKFADVTGTLQDITSSVDDYYIEYTNLQTRGFNKTQTWFWDAVESFNNAPDGTTHTITLTESFEFPYVRRAYDLFKEGQNKKIIIQGDSVGQAITNSGKTLDGYLQLEAEGPLFNVPSGITLELGNNITLDGNGTTFPVVIVENGGTFIMNNGSTVEGANDCGVEVKGTFTMNGGTISGNRYSDHFYGGWITSGGGVSVESGTFTMNGGTIRDNVQYDNGFGGGGVSVAQGTFTMTSGTISGNTTNPSELFALFSRGGGVFVSANGSFTKTGGTIDDTNYAKYGKVAYVSNGVRNTTAGPNDNLNSAVTGTAGGWEE